MGISVTHFLGHKAMESRADLLRKSAELPYLWAAVISNCCAIQITHKKRLHVVYFKLFTITHSLRAVNHIKTIPTGFSHANWCT